jgi:hypothetical protein
MDVPLPVLLTGNKYFMSYVVGDVGHAHQPGGAAGGRARRRLGQAQPRRGGLLPGGLRGGGVGAAVRGNQRHVAHPSGQGMQQQLLLFSLEKRKE